ncbi:MAG: endonuclease III domain-containing protein [Candidatus Bathyarchaeia archaeon]
MNRLIEHDGATALNRVGKDLPRDPFKVLITTILSQRTRDDNTRKAAGQLFSHYPTVESLAEADVGHVANLIRPSGFYRVKASSIISIARILMGRYGGKVPKELDRLLELPLVGRKTANCVLVYGFNIPAIPVDTHVHRIVNRLSIVKTRTPEETELRLRERVSREFWLSLNEELVKFGQRICKPFRPRCVDCKIKMCCGWYRSRRRLIEAKEGRRPTHASPR